MAHEERRDNRTDAVHFTFTFVKISGISWEVIENEDETNTHDEANTSQTYDVPYISINVCGQVCSSRQLQLDCFDQDTNSGNCTAIFAPNRVFADKINKNFHDQNEVNNITGSASTTSSALPEIFNMDVDLIHTHSSHHTTTSTTIARATHMLFTDDFDNEVSQEQNILLRKCSMATFCVSTNDDIQKRKRIRLSITDNATLHLRIQTDDHQDQAECASVDSKSAESRISNGKSESPQSLASTYAHLNIYDDEYFDYYNHTSGPKETIADQTKETTKANSIENNIHQKAPTAASTKVGTAATEALTSTHVPTNAKEDGQEHANVNANGQNESGCKMLASVGEVVSYLFRAAGQCDEDFQSPYYPYNNRHHNPNFNDACSTIATEDFTHVTFPDDQKIHLEFG